MQCPFEVLVGRFREAAKSIVDERLIATASGLVNLVPEPVKKVIVDPNGDSRLARRSAKNRAAPTIPKVVLLLHLTPSYGGARLVAAPRGKAVAVLSPPSATDTDRRIEAMLREGVARWGGGKPTGSRRPPRVKGRSVAQAVIEGRR